jgi:hypothetical protein
MLFPFTLYAEETPHYTSSPFDFRPTFLQVRPKDMGWYAYDVEIKSPTEVTFTVRAMRDACSGGIGDKIGTLTATVDPALTRKAITNRAMALAAARRASELYAEEQRIILSYAEELLAAI